MMGKVIDPLLRLLVSGGGGRMPGWSVVLLPCVRFPLGALPEKLQMWSGSMRRRSASGWLHADLESMRIYLEDFSRSLPTEVHALLVCDQAGWHTSGRLVVPDNVTLLHLPSKSPELNPAELLWREMRQKHLGKRVFPEIEIMCDAVTEELSGINRRAASLQ